MPNTQEDNQLKAVCSKLKYANIRLQSEAIKKEKLLSIIMRTEDEDDIEEAFEDEELAINYYAKEGTYLNKRGVESACYKSIYGRYAGKITDTSVAPVLQYYKIYNSKVFKPNFTTYKMECRAKVINKDGVKYKVAK